MEGLARRVLKNPIEILVGGKSVVSSNVTQYVEIIEPSAKFFRLLQLLGEKYVSVFCFTLFHICPTNTKEQPRWPRAHFRGSPGAC